MTRGLWDYVHAPHIAEQYDEYFAGNTLFEFDQGVLERTFQRPGVLVDLGCGTGRLLLPFVRRGFHGIGVDLSAAMLGVLRRKAAAEGLSVDCLLADITALDGLADGVADYCICMFSTLGMIRGRANRHRALCHARRILKPGGLLVLHVHNRWYNLFLPQGRSWLVRNRVAAWLRRDVEVGDKFFDYRGVRNMFLHVFTLRELKRDLRRAGFVLRQVIPLDTARRHALRWPWLLGRLRANGWITVCQRPDAPAAAASSAEPGRTGLCRRSASP